MPAIRYSTAVDARPNEPEEVALIEYTTRTPLEVEDVIRVFRSSGIRRPIDDPPRIARMLAAATLVVSAWDGNRMVGVARSLTDFSYACYLSDLAVDGEYQKQGIGRGLIEHTREEIGPEVLLLLVPLPSAMEYYPRLGFERSERTFLIPRER